MYVILFQTTTTLRLALEDSHFTMIVCHHRNVYKLSRGQHNAQLGQAYRGRFYYYDSIVCSQKGCPAE